ncbi:MAG: DUF2782 domain-containing protein [Gammaproteobacteria bacterium HGW-Gammaproteobacteria-3]|nr:MAG: DUF2782 domain-containing protein [Gammaproteobacteria bacterium HGW-Gammaproteobacteria-3]
MRPFIFFFPLLVSFFAFAQEAPPPPDIEGLPEPPDALMPIESGETMEPDITIIRKGKQTIQEYRINGDLYMIKIIPDRGFPYYMIDTDGDGNLDVRGTDLEKGIHINQWKLLEWD